jgi:soluble lytic murein transglycosylase-like protein
MARQTTRRVALLAVVGGAAAWAAITLHAPVGAPAAHAAAAPSHVRGLTSARAIRYVRPRCPLPETLRPAFVRASRDAHVPLALLYAVGRVESNLRVDAASSAGARGILQVMPATARALNLDVEEPASNVLAGARYLRQLIDRFHDSDLALAAYNAGPTVVARTHEAPSVDVLRYVANVDLLWHGFDGCR